MSGNVPAPGETNLRRIVQGIRDLFEGRRNTTGTVTLTANAATTTVTNINFGAESVPHLTPITAAAATEFGAGTWHISARTAGSFTITHVNSAVTTRTFLYSFDG